MKALEKLSPAEALFVIDQRASMTELLQVTLLDLLMRRVLISYDDERRIVGHLKSITYVKPGPGFDACVPRDYERTFIDLFRENRGQPMLFNNMSVLSRQHSGGDQQFKARLMKSDVLKTYITTSFWQKVFGGFSLTEEGHRLKEQIEQEIAELQTQFVLAGGDIEKSHELMSGIGGHAGLLSRKKGKHANSKFSIDELSRKNLQASGPDFFTWISLTEIAEDLASTDPSFDGD